MTEPLTDHEDRRFDVEAEEVVLERRSMSLPHEEVDKTNLSRSHVLGPLAERDTSSIDNAQVVGALSIKSNEATARESPAHSVISTTSMPISGNVEVGYASSGV